MTTPETKLKEAVIKRLKRHRDNYEPIWWMKIAGSPQQLRGVPDLLIVLRGRAIFVELKQPGKKPTPLQCHRVGEIAAAGASVVLCTSVDEFDEFMSSRLT